VRKDGQAIGRVYDNRFDLACEGEGKFPLGYWMKSFAISRPLIRYST